MKRFAMLLIVLSFSVSSALMPPEAGACSFAYNASGGFSMDKVTSFDVELWVVPQKCNPSMQFNSSEMGRFAYIHESNPSSPYIWSFSCVFGMEKELPMLDSLFQFPHDFSGNFTRFGYYSDFDQEIQEQASSIVEGSQTVLEAGMRLAKWVHENIEYDRDYDYLYENQKGRASEVFETRKGVCDEFTSLFLSMAKSVGIPARYVSGIAYSDIYAGYGMHAWAEFFAGTWISVDLTFGEFGVLDATHIPLTYSLDGGVSPIVMTWTGYSGNVFSPINPFPKQDNCVLGPEQFSIFIDGNCSSDPTTLETEMSVDRTTISDNDYLLVTFGLTNPYQSYIVVPVRFMRIQEAELAYGTYEDYALVPPLSKTTKKYLLHVSDLDDWKTYTLPLHIDSDFSRNLDMNVTIDPRVPGRDISYYLPNLSEGHVYNPAFEIEDLLLSPNPTYSNRTFLSFSARNRGNKILEFFLNLTYGSSRETFDLGILQINEKSDFNISVEMPERGEFNARLDFYSENISLSREAILIGAPAQDVAISYSGKREFGNEPISFNLSKSECASGRVYFITGVAGLSYDQASSHFELPPEMFFPGENMLNISFLCIDKYGTSFFNSTSENININVSGFDYLVWLFRAAIMRIINFFEPKLL
jgi:hypothetical protein